MLKAELRVLKKELEKVFDIVRIVDVSLMKEYSVSECDELIEGPYQCYAVWNVDGRCENCISAKAFSAKSQMTKFEFVNDKVYFVVSKYIEIEDVPYMLEMVTEITDETLFGAFGFNAFIDNIKGYNHKLYIDTLTGAYNRTYYNEQLSNLPKINAVAMVDVDNFKQINDTFGHPVGDYILQEVVRTMQSKIRSADAVVRYGGDEFVITFNGISKSSLSERLEEIRQMVDEHYEERYPDLHVTLSIGAVISSEAATNSLHLADEALYVSKKSKNKVEIVEI